MVDERKIWAKVIGVVTFVLLEIASLSMLKHAGSLQDIWVSKASHRFMAWAWRCLARMDLIVSTRHRQSMRDRRSL